MQRAEPMEEPPGVRYLGFNQDQSCLAVGTCRGFRIFSTESFALLHQEACGAVSLVEMLFRTSLLALVGCSSARAPSARRLTMWNTKERCELCQLHFAARIHGVRMNHRRLAVLLRQKLHIFDLRTMRSLHVLDRAPSPWADPALAWLCAASERGYLATPLALAGSGPTHSGIQGPPCWPSAQYPAGPLDAGATGPMCDGDGSLPGEHHGHVPECPEAKLGLVSVVDTYTLKPVGTVLAHHSPVQALCLNPTGQLLATASTKGTVVRLFAVPALDTLYCFRRGASACRIFGLTFSRDSAQLCASAASGTVHVFRSPERLLGALPLQSEEATVGAAHREMLARSKAQAPPGAGLPEAPALRLGPPAPEAGAEAEAEAEELGDWNVVAERPERLLELCINEPSYGGSCSRKSALQTLSAVSEYAVENTAKYAKSLLHFLPQPCRELMDAPRAFAWVHLRGEEELRGGGERHRPDVLQGPSGPTTQNTVGPYVACVSSKPRTGNERLEVLVATARGCAHVYDWNPAVGGECRLRTEHCFLGPWPQRCGGGRLLEVAEAGQEPCELGPAVAAA